MSSLNPKIDQTIKILVDKFGNNFTTNKGVRNTHSKDESWHHPSIPDGVVFPNSNEEISEMLLSRLDEVNSELVNYKKISTLIIVKDEWTQENGIVGPTQKLKRGEIQDKYSNNYLKWHESDEKIIFE